MKFGQKNFCEILLHEFFWPGLFKIFWPTVIIHLSKDIAVKLRTEAATVTIAMKLLKVQYVDPKTHFRSLIVTKLKLQFNDANIKSAKLILAMNALGTTHIERCAEKKKDNYS